MIIADSIGKYRIRSNAYLDRTAGFDMDQGVVVDNLLKIRIRMCSLSVMY